MIASEVLSKRPPPALQPRLIDWASMSWPVHARYEVRQDHDGQTRLIPRGRVRRKYQPIAIDGLFAWLKPLATGSDAEISAWVRENGLVGIRPARRLGGETTDEIREWVGHYLRCVATLIDVRRRKRSAAELVQLISVPINHLLTVDVVAATDFDAVLLLPVIASHGPLSAAYQEILGSGSVEDEVTRSRFHWRQPRACEHCGGLFRPRRTGQVFCKGNCRRRAHDHRQRSELTA